MRLNLKRKSLAAATLGAMLSMGTVVVPNAAMAAFDSPAPIRPADPSVTSAGATTLGGGVLLSDSGAPITTGAWCDPLTNACERHPWTRRNRGGNGHGR
jgi:hypothetical protein